MARSSSCRAPGWSGMCSNTTCTMAARSQSPLACMESRRISQAEALRVEELPMQAERQSREDAEHDHRQDGDGTLTRKAERIYELLIEVYGIPPWEPDGDALGGLIATVLSQHTSDVNSERAYAELVRTFPTWEAVRDAPVAAVAAAIRQGGLAQVKAERIHHILREL